MEKAVPPLPKKAARPQDTLEFHPLADVFPLMEGAEFKALVADIKANNQRDPIVLFKGQILDGRNRYRACLELGIKPEVVKGDIWVGDPAAYVISVNIRRRHLKPADKRKAIAALLKLHPDKSDRQIAETTKSSPTTVGKIRTKEEAKGVVSNVDTRRDKRGRRQPARKPRPSKRATKRGRKSRTPAATNTSPAAPTPTNAGTPSPAATTTSPAGAPAPAPITTSPAASTATNAAKLGTPAATDATKPGTAAFDLMQSSPWELARIIVAKIEGVRARDIACAILDQIELKLDKADRKSIGERMKENSAAQIAKLQDEKRQLETKCLALEGEVKDLRDEIAELKVVDLFDALVTLLRATPEDERAHTINVLMKEVLDRAKGDSATVEPTPPVPTATELSANSNTAIGQWQIKPQKYVNSWSWFATNGSVSLNSNPTTLFATPEEAETNARAVIAGAEPAEDRRQ
jgi:ParB-like chromosome segregation protein Spo0J